MAQMLFEWTSDGCAINPAALIDKKSPPQSHALHSYMGVNMVYPENSIFSALSVHWWKKELGIGKIPSPFVSGFSTVRF